MIIADATANAQTVAVDLLIEAEHGADSQALLVTSSRQLADQVAERIGALIEETPEPRREFLISVFSNLGGIILTESEDQSVEIVNLIAPEHLKVQTADPWATADGIRNAGEILLGEHSAFSLANYAAGANAVLPTGGHARSWSGVSVHDFQKRSGIVQVSEGAAAEIGRHAQTLAEYEGFYWHARALRDRG
jgi:histidinol dehydrogenase